MDNPLTKFRCVCFSLKGRNNSDRLQINKALKKHIIIENLSSLIWTSHAPYILDCFTVDHFHCSV